jgi:outer membrane protein OmpA-like peptidoglycan-associated protein
VAAPNTNGSPSRSTTETKSVAVSTHPSTTTAPTNTTAVANDSRENVELGFISDNAVTANDSRTVDNRSDTSSVDPDAANREYREQSLRLGNSISGSVGLLHMQTAFSGAPGTFRVSFLSGYYSGSKFLCPHTGACDTTSGSTSTTDKAESISSDIAVSATLTSYLEGYVAMHSVATSNTLGSPKLLQIVGDTNFGLKAFLPAKPDRIFSVGGSLDLWLLNGSGSLGVDQANFTMRALAGLDFTRRTDPKKRIPIRLHTTFGYLVDGSGALIEDVEQSRGGNRISRIERFGLDINRVDSFLLGFGAEYVHKYVQPFIEWTFDVPNNRQDYRCARKGSGRATGDSCLALDSGFSATPSRLTLGTRITPGGLHGLSGLFAFDIGTGATSTFIEEVAPEIPWKLFFGLSFAHDMTSAGSTPVVKTRTVEKLVQLPPPREHHVVGLVLDERTQQPVPNAIVKYQGQTLTGMVSRPDGSFETSNLQPGTYSFVVSADGFREGICQVTLSSTSTTSTTPTTTTPQTTSAVAGNLGTSTSAPTTTGVAATSSTVSSGPVVTNVTCPLKALPAVGTIQGALIDAESSTGIAGARATVRDAKGRELSVDADGSGAFRFENVPAGTVRISVEANGYMPQTTEVDVRARSEQRSTISLSKRPKKANVVVTAKEVKLSKKVNFANDSAAITADSSSLLQEIALTLKEHPELTRVEIQGHTDNSGTPAYNKRLSQERAEAVRNALVSLGVETSRLTAVGYGQEKPLGPNSSDAAKAKNRRVQLLILERQ